MLVERERLDEGPQHRQRAARIRHRLDRAAQAPRRVATMSMCRCGRGGRDDPDLDPPRAHDRVTRQHRDHRDQLAVHAEHADVAQVLRRVDERVVRQERLVRAGAHRGVDERDEVRHVGRDGRARTIDGDGIGQAGDCQHVVDCRQSTQRRQGVHARHRAHAAPGGAGWEPPRPSRLPARASRCRPRASTATRSVGSWTRPRRATSTGCAGWRWARTTRPATTCSRSPRRPISGSSRPTGCCPTSSPASPDSSARSSTTRRGCSMGRTPSGASRPVARSRSSWASSPPGTVPAVSTRRSASPRWWSRSRPIPRSGRAPTTSA